MWCRPWLALVGVAWAGAAAAGTPPTAAVLGLVADDGAACAAARAELTQAGVAVLGPGPIRDALERPTSIVAPLRQVDDVLARARAAYDDFASPVALAHLAEVDAALAGEPATAAIVAALAARQRIAGLVLLADGRGDEAAAAFGAAVALDPTHPALDPATHPPAAVAAYRAAAAAAPPWGRLTVTTRPPEATVSLDGRSVAPDAAVAAGLHWLVVESPGFAARGQWIAVRGGETRAEAVTLTRAPPALRIAALRARLLAPTTSAGELRAASAEIAALAGVELLVLLRRRGGAIEQARYDAARASLGPWTGPAAPAAVDLRIPPTADPPWHRAWWGRGLLVVGGAVAVGAMAYLLWPAADDEGSRIGRWCFEAACPLRPALVLAIAAGCAGAPAEFAVVIEVEPSCAVDSPAEVALPCAASLGAWLLDGGGAVLADACVAYADGPTTLAGLPAALAAIDFGAIHADELVELAVYSPAAADCPRPDQAATPPRVAGHSPVARRAGLERLVVSLGCAAPPVAACQPCDDARAACLADREDAARNCDLTELFCESKCQDPDCAELCAGQTEMCRAELADCEADHAACVAATCPTC